MNQDRSRRDSHSSDPTRIAGTPTGASARLGRGNAAALERMRAEGAGTDTKAEIEGVEKASPAEVGAAVGSGATVGQAPSTAPGSDAGAASKDAQAGADKEVGATASGTTAARAATGATPAQAPTQAPATGPEVSAPAEGVEETAAVETSGGEQGAGGYARAAPPPAPPGARAGGPAAAGGGGGGLTLDQLALDAAVADAWGVAPESARTVAVVPDAPSPLSTVPAQTGLGPMGPAQAAAGRDAAAMALDAESRRALANQAVSSGLAQGGADALMGLGLEIPGMILARQGPMLAAKGGTLGARVAGGALGSAIPVVGGVFSAIDLYHQVSTIGEKPWGSMFSDVVSFLDCIGTVLQIVGDVVGIVAAVLAVAGVITAIAGVGLAIGGAAATLGMVGLAISALGMIVQGAAAAIRYTRIVSGESDPARLEGDLSALQGNVAASSGQLGNLVSHGASTAVEGRIDMRNRVGLADQLNPVSHTGGAGGGGNNAAAPIQQGAANTFANETYTSGRLVEDAYVTRLFGNNEAQVKNRTRSFRSNAPGKPDTHVEHYYDADPQGQFLGHGVPGNLAQGREMNALPPEWNPGGSLAVLKVAKGTEYHQGTIAPVATPQGGVPTAFPHGAPAGASGQYGGGGTQGYLPRKAGADNGGFPDLEVVDVMPFDPDRGGWRPAIKGTIAGKEPTEALGLAPPAPSFPDVSTLDVGTVEVSDAVRFEDELAAAGTRTPPEAELRPLTPLAPSPVDAGVLAGRVATMGQLALKASLLDVAADSGDTWAGAYDRALSDAGPYAQLGQAQARDRAELSAQGAEAASRQARAEDGDARVAELEAQQQQAQGERGKAQGGGSAVDTVVGAASNSAVRGLVKVGTGVGGAVAGGINAVGSLFGADEPVIDTSVLDRVNTLMDKGPTLGRQYADFKGRAGGFDRMSTAPRQVVDDHSARLDHVAQGQEAERSRIARDEATLAQARAELGEERDAARVEAEALRAEAEALRARQAEEQAIYDSELAAAEAWSATHQAARAANAAALAEARTEAAAPQPTADDLATLATGSAAVGRARGFLDESGAALRERAASQRRSAEAANGAPFPGAYATLADGVLAQFQHQVGARFAPALAAMESALAQATPDRVGTVVTAVHATCDRIRAAVDAAFQQAVRALAAIYVHRDPRSAGAAPASSDGAAEPQPAHGG